MPDGNAILRATMGRITLYILRQLVTGTVLVTVGLLCILWLTQSLRFIDLIVNEGASVGTFLSLTGLLLPNFLIFVLPISLFGVVLFSYNKLNTDRELVVMRAAGLSPLGLARPALLLAGVLSLTGWFLTLYAVPESVRAFREMQWTVRNDVGRLLIREGAFNTVMPGVTVYVRSRLASGVLQGLLVQDSRKPEQTVTLMAERGALLAGEHGPRVLMVNGNRQEVTTGTGQMSLLYFDSYTLDLKTSSSGEKSDRFRDARERPLSELLTIHSGSDASVSENDIHRFRVEAHQRIANPLSAVSLTLIALAFLLTGSFDRRGSGKRLLFAVGALVLVEILMIGSGNMAVKSLILIPLIYLSVLLPGGLALLVLVRPQVLRYLLRRK